MGNCLQTEARRAANTRMADNHPHQSVVDRRSQVIVPAEQGNTQNFSALLQICENLIQDDILTRDVYEGSVVKTAAEHHRRDIVSPFVQESHVGIFPDKSSWLDDALFLASKHDNMKMVLEFVELGANVNIVHGKLTPLIAACYNQSISMVELLIKSGADVNLRPSEGVPPLMALLLSSNEQSRTLSILNWLLFYGADCNWQDENGDTALHEAASTGKTAVVRMLLSKHPRILPNKWGFTPLFLAVETNKMLSLHPFFCSNAVSREEMINALEYEAASMAPLNLKTAYRFLHQAWMARISNHRNILWKPKCEPIAAFGGVVESQTPEELEKKKGDSFAILMECLAVQHRLLGGGTGKMFRTRNFYSNWKKLLKQKKYEQAMALAEQGIGDTDCYWAEKIFNKLLLDQEISILSVFERGLQLCINILCRNQSSVQTYSELGLKLLNRCIQLKLNDPALAKKFLDSFPLQGPPRFGSALHAATYLMIKGKFDLSAYKSVVDLLVKCEAEIDKKDEERYTVLDYVLHDMMPGNSQKEIVEFLLEMGANPAYLSNVDDRPNDYMKDADVVELLRHYYPLPLRHLAALAVVDNSVHYEGQVPNIVAKFIRGHE